MSADLPPFSGLEPGLILDAVERLGLVVDGRLLALNSFENRVYQVGLVEADPVVVKFYRPHRWPDLAIAEEHDFLRALEAAEVPVVAPIMLKGASLHFDQGFRFALWPRRGGRAPEFDFGDTLERMGRALARLHQVGSQQPFRHRPSLDLAGFGEASRDFLLASGLIPPEVRSEWTAITRQALDAVGCAFERYPAIPYLRLHGDCHAGNVLWTDQGAHFVDFDDCLTGPAVQDMWMMFSGSPEEIARQRREFLRGYRTFRDFDESEFALVEPLRTLRLIHYSAWLARRWNDPAFPPAFPFFGSVHYWRDRVHEMAEQLSLMRRCP